MYLLFAGARYYPDGGWKDFIGEFNSLDDCKEALADWVSSDPSDICSGWWWQIVKDKQIVYEGSE